MSRVVNVKFYFLRLGDIDTIKESFEATIFVEAYWREPSLNDKEKADVDWSKVWSPKISVDNAIGDLKETSTSSLEFIENLKGREAFVRQRIRIRGKFYEKMELKHFPFDTQEITIRLVSASPADEIFLQTDIRHSARTTDEFIFTDEQEWDLVSAIEAKPSDHYSKCQMEPGYRASLSFTTHVIRKSSFYIVNIWIISIILCGLALCIFGLERTNLQGRLQLSFILILTTVTFKFFVAGHIPKVSYLTLLDKAVLLNFFFLVILALWHTIQNQFTNNDPNHILHQHEKWAVLTFGVLYVITMTILFLAVFYKARSHQLFVRAKANKVIPAPPMYHPSQKAPSFKIQEPQELPGSFENQKNKLTVY